MHFVAYVPQLAPQFEQVLTLSGIVSEKWVAPEIAVLGNSLSPSMGKALSLRRRLGDVCAIVSNLYCVLMMKRVKP